ncbi:acylphosphatase [Selenihalanaerobacter shriftii]|uniref:acylphosphatase n=1 Tax=Selenihalanaerobacter shriftii TaxID=142842 RepID=A0A1T4PBK9_9FIRM|nr:acylphosphatase [Selenihalanaerobacter shriftii]SJZ88626.1 acylphosphatase [Selenihalanaerobacter shriftii]
MSDKSAVRVTIQGRVQGVGYRTFAHQKSTQLGLTGYIRNLGGNEVEVVAEGEEGSLEQLIDFLEVGPTRAEIEEVDTEWIDYTGDHIRFAIKY